MRQHPPTLKLFTHGGKTNMLRVTVKPVRVSAPQYSDRTIRYWDVQRKQWITVTQWATHSR